MERRTIDAKIKLNKRDDMPEDAKPCIEGCAARFYREDEPGTEFELAPMCKERIMPGAFDVTEDVRGLFNHDANMILGRTKAGTMRLSIDADGLKYEIDPPDTSIGEMVRAACKRGDVTGSSFSFDITEQKWIDMEDGSMIREIHKCRLYDVGPVTFPAYEATSAMARAAGINDPLKAFNEHRQQREAAAKSLAELRKRMS